MRWKIGAGLVIGCVSITMGYTSWLSHPTTWSPVLGAMLGLACFAEGYWMAHYFSLRGSPLTAAVAGLISIIIGELVSIILPGPWTTLASMMIAFPAILTAHRHVTRPRGVR